MIALHIQPAIDSADVLQDVFTDEHGRAFTTSLKVAERFGKMHKNVLQDIHSLNCSERFSRLNFQPSDYVNSRGKKYPAYNITRDGVTFLVTGYHCANAGQYKEAYIEAFNQLEERARTPALDLNNPATLQSLLLKQIAENAQAVKQLAAAAPAIAFHKTCKTAPDEMTLTEWAKTISHKVRAVIDALKGHFIYYSGHSLVPYQQYIANGAFTLRYTSIEKTNGELKEVAKVRVTAKGMLKLHEWLQHHHPDLLRVE